MTLQCLKNDDGRERRGACIQYTRTLHSYLMWEPVRIDSQCPPVASTPRPVSRCESGTFMMLSRNGKRDEVREV